MCMCGVLYSYFGVSDIQDYTKHWVSPYTLFKSTLLMGLGLRSANGPKLRLFRWLLLSCCDCVTLCLLEKELRLHAVMYVTPPLPDRPTVVSQQHLTGFSIITQALKGRDYYILPSKKPKSCAPWSWQPCCGFSGGDAGNGPLSSASNSDAVWRRPWVPTQV